MWIASRSPQTAVSAVTTSRRTTSPSPAEAAKVATATAVKAAPQATSTIRCTPMRSATAKVASMTANEAPAAQARLSAKAVQGKPMEKPFIAGPASLGAAW